MQFETKHWIVIGAMLVAIGTQVGGLEHGWRDATTPGFIGGLIVQIGATVGAIFVGAPIKPWNGQDRRE